MHTRFCALLVLVPGIISAAPDFQQLIHMGQEALAKSDLAAAATLYGQACGTGLATLRPEQRASCEHHLAVIDQARGDLPTAEARLSRALTAWLEAGDGFTASYVMSLLNLGEIYRIERRFSESEQLLKRAVDLARGTQQAWPQEYPHALSRLAGLYVESDRADAGRPLLTEALKLFGALPVRQYGEEARALNSLAAVDVALGMNSEGGAKFREAVDLAESKLGSAHPDTASYQADLALYYIQARQYDRADPLLKRARFVVEAQPLPNNLRLGTIMVEQSVVACAQGKFGIAEEYSHEAQKILDRAPGATSAARLLANVSLAVAWLKTNHLAQAEEILPGTVEEERRIAPGSCLLADGLRELAELRAQQHSLHEAAALYKEAIGIYEQKLGSNNRNLAPVLKEYADVLRHDGGSKSEARALESKAKAILSFVPPA